MIKKRGITLIELLITISLIGLILIVTTSVYLTGFRTYKEQLTSSIVQSNAQTILDALVLDAKNGLLIEATYGSFTTGPDCIIIQVPSIDASKNILYSGSDELFDRVIYYYQNNQIHKITYADPSSVRHSKDGIDTTLDKNVLSLSFVYDPPDEGAAHLVKITLSSDIKVGNRDKEITITGEARLRNHI